METENSPHYVYVDSDAAAAALAESLAGADRIAMDTEANGLHRYHQRICLIQLSFAGENYIVDPLADVDLGPILHQLANTPLIIHGVDFDLRMMRSTFGFVPNAPIFDTMIAGRLLGFERPGLSPLLGELFDIPICKAGQKSDWTRRPLDPAQLRYASDDTRWLEQLANALAEQLEAAGRTHWAEQSTAAAIESAATDQPTDVANAWRIRGSVHLSPAQAAYLRELWAWRERISQQADRPPFKIMPNALLTHLAIWGEKNPGKPIGREIKLPRHILGPRRSDLESAMADAHRLGPDQYPAPRLRKGPPAVRPGKKLPDLQQGISKAAEELHLPASTVVPRAALERLSRAPATEIDEIVTNAEVLPWQAEILQPIAQEIWTT